MKKPNMTKIEQIEHFQTCVHRFSLLMPIGDFHHHHTLYIMYASRFKSPKKGNKHEFLRKMFSLGGLHWVFDLFLALCDKIPSYWRVAFFGSHIAQTDAYGRVKRWNLLQRARYGQVGAISSESRPHRCRRRFPAASLGAQSHLHSKYVLRRWMDQTKVPRVSCAHVLRNGLANNVVQRYVWSCRLISLLRTTLQCSATKLQTITALSHPGVGPTRFPWFMRDKRESPPFEIFKGASLGPDAQKIKLKRVLRVGCPISNGSFGTTFQSLLTQLPCFGRVPKNEKGQKSIFSRRNSRTFESFETWLYFIVFCETPRLWLWESFFFFWLWKLHQWWILGMGDCLNFLEGWKENYYSWCCLVAARWFFSHLHLQATTRWDMVAESSIFRPKLPFSPMLVSVITWPFRDHVLKTPRSPTWFPCTSATCCWERKRGSLQKQRAHFLSRGLKKKTSTLMWKSPWATTNRLCRSKSTSESTTTPDSASSPFCRVPRTIACTSTWGSWWRLRSTTTAPKTHSTPSMWESCGLWKRDFLSRSPNRKLLNTLTLCTCPWNHRSVKRFRSFLERLEKWEIRLQKRKNIFVQWHGESKNNL